jgi:predicted esterase
LGTAAAADPAAVQQALDRFLSAPDRDAAARLMTDVAGSGVTFDDAYARLKQGRNYSKTAPHGLRRLSNRTSDGLEHEYIVIVPDNYDAARAYQVRVQLHGGIGRPSAQPGREGIDRIVGTRDQIYVHPNGYVKAMWWFANQIENIGGILDEVKRTYNVDENRVYLTGISDGGTGAYFMAFRDTTPWASFLPLNGHMIVLANPNTEADGDVQPSNAANKPFFIVNGGRDPLYPTRSVEPYIDLLQKLGTVVVYHPQPEAGHNTDWWPTERQSFEKFVHDHPRDPLPDHVTWETERTDRYNRAHWLVIDELGPAPGESKVMDVVVIDDGPNGSQSVSLDEIFPRSRLQGRVDLDRKGNIVNASTMGVRAFTLLLSPDEFDFSAPIRVVTNGHVAFDGKVNRSVSTLLKWAAHDNDRTMLFGAELKVVVK